MSLSALFFLLAYACGVLGAIFLDGALGIYIYQFEYFANPVRRWWAYQLPRYPVFVDYRACRACGVRDPREEVFRQSSVCAHLR